MPETRDVGRVRVGNFSPEMPLDERVMRTVSAPDVLGRYTRFAASPNEVHQVYMRSGRALLEATARIGEMMQVTLATPYGRVTVTADPTVPDGYLYAFPGGVNDALLWRAAQLEGDVGDPDTAIVIAEMFMNRAVRLREKSGD